MKIYFKIKIVLFILISLFSWTTFGQITTQKVTFPTGKSSVVVNGTIKGNESIDYMVSVSKNQVMKVDLKTKNLSCYFNVLPPGSNDVAVFIGSTEGNNFNQTLSQSGVYKIRVYLMRNEARRGTKVSFSLNIGVTGKLAPK